MTNEELERANYLQEKIKELESFIWHSEHIWTGKIIKRDTKYIFKANDYGCFEDKEFKLNTSMKNRILDVLREHLKEMKDELKNI
jgi:hypothetical protein